MSTILIAGHDGVEVSSFVNELLRNQDVEIRLISEISSELKRERVTWVACDPFSCEDLLAAMRGVDELYYFEKLASKPLELVQGSSEDIELLLVTGILRAAKASGVKKVYLKQALNNPSLEVQNLFQMNAVSTQNNPSPSLSILEKKKVRSIQRFVLPPKRDAVWTGEEYFRWLPKFFSNIIRVKYDGKECVFSLFHEKIAILVLRRSKAFCESRTSFKVVGGLLNKKNSNGRLEFVESLDKNFVFGALHSFSPALPWTFYRLTQSVVHVLVMAAFGEHLKWCYLKEDKK